MADLAFMAAPGASLPAEPCFLQGGAGPIFAIYFPPQGATAARAVVLVPPFAEEMNRSRRMLSLQARQLAAAGIGALIVDPFGTGDSAGDFADARWETWIADVIAAAHWLKDRGIAEIGMLGLRLGAPLAAAAQHQAELRCFRTVFWQPIIQGRSAVTEFLRLNIGAGMLGKESGRTMDVMRAHLAAGEHVEVAGYALPAELATAIEKIDFGAMADKDAGPVSWLEIVRSEGGEISAGGRQCVERWAAAGVDVVSAGVEGRPFWFGQTITLVPALLTATTLAFAGAEG